MAIQSKLPFQFFLTTRDVKGNNFSCSEQPVQFFSSLEDLHRRDYRPELSIPENTDIYIQLRTNYPFRLEMEGMNVLNNPLFTHDDAFYLDIPNTEILLFSHTDFPLPPGNGIIEIFCQGKKYFTGFEVTSEHRMSREAWEQMAAETYEEIGEMARQMVYQKLGIRRQGRGDNFLISIFERMAVVNKFFAPVIAALNDLQSNPHCRIVKNYVLSNKNRQNSPADFRSFRLNARIHGGEKAYVSQKYKDYNLPENRYVKKIIRNIQKLLRQFANEAQVAERDVQERSVQSWYVDTRYQGWQNVRSQIVEYIDRARKLSYTITFLEESPWYGEIAESRIDYLPAQSVFDPRYEILDKLNRDLKATDRGADANANLTYIWERSSKLYELWGVIKIIHALQDLGFELQEGPWLLRDEEQSRLGGLKAGETVTLTSGNFLVRLTYDGDLPVNQAATDEEKNPIYVLDLTRHRTPDCRLDFYLVTDINTYLGTLVVDCKYRVPKYIWSDSGYSDKEQLVAYGNFTRSKYLKGCGANYSNNALQPVYEVWALHPDAWNPGQVTVYFDYGVRLISMVPGERNVLTEQLRRFMAEYIEVKENGCGR